MTTTPDFRALCAELVKLARRNHYTYGDPWYSCPKSPDGCTNDAAGNDCTCGADSHNDKVDELLAIALATPPPEPPTDEELQSLWHELFSHDDTVSSGDVEVITRAVLERWGQR